MIYVNTILPQEAKGETKKIYDEIKKSSGGMVPNILRVLSLRPDLMGIVAALHRNLMLEPHALDRTTKELIAAYVSKINGCEY